MNVLTPQKKNAVITLLQHGVSQREIERKIGVDRKTIRKVARTLAAAPNSPTPATGMTTTAEQIPPPWPPALALLGLPVLPTPIAVVVRSACEPHSAWITTQIGLGRNAMAIFQELVDTRGFGAGYNSVKRFCRNLRRREPEQFDRLEFLPGEEAQVDYGEGAPTRHPTSGRYRKPRLFVMTLRYSRRSYRQVVWSSSSEVWARLHEQAFRYFGGCPQYVVLDNLKEGVITPDIYEPELNRVYAQTLEHYGVVADPARIQDPNRKGSVESAIQHTQSTALQGKRFESLQAQNDFLLHWEERWAARRIHGRAKRQVEEMFQEERPHLRPLPLTTMRYFVEGVRTVQDDTTIQVDGAWYAARPAPIGSRVLTRLFEHELEIRNQQTLALIRRHPRATRKGTVLLPDAERVFNPSRQTKQVLAQAEALGSNVHALCQALFAARGREAQKAMWGIVGLGSRIPARVVDEAAALAMARQLRSYKAIRALAEQLLAAAIAQLPLMPLAPALTQQHELIRSADTYAAFFTAAQSANAA